MYEVAKLEYQKGATRKVRFVIQKNVVISSRNFIVKTLYELFIFYQMSSSHTYSLE